MHRSATTATLSRSCECRWSRGSRARRRLMQQRRKRSRNRIEILFRSGPVQRSLCMYDAIKHECIEAVYPCSIADVCRLRGVAMLRARNSDPHSLSGLRGATNAMTRRRLRLLLRLRLRLRHQHWHRHQATPTPQPHPHPHTQPPHPQPHPHPTPLPLPVDTGIPTTCRSTRTGEVLYR